MKASRLEFFLYVGHMDCSECLISNNEERSSFRSALLFQKITDMSRRHIGQLAKDLVALLLVEGQGLKTGGFQMIVGDALASGVLLHGAKQAGAPAIAAEAFIDPEPLDMEPAPFYLPEDTAQHHTICILDKAGDPLAQQLARYGLIETVEAVAQGLKVIGLRRLGVG